MKTTHTVWTHGLNLQVEDQQAIKSLTRYGCYTRIIGKKGQGAWVHCPIPSPTITDGQRLCLASVMVRFSSGAPNTHIAQIKVFDGEAPFFTRDGLHIAQGWETLLHRETIDTERLILWGVCLSLHFRFDGKNDLENTIALAAAGGDFYRPIPNYG